MPFSLFLDHFLRFCLFGEAQGGVSAIFPSISLKHCEPFYPFPSKAKWEPTLRRRVLHFIAFVLTDSRRECLSSSKKSEQEGLFCKKKLNLE